MFVEHGILSHNRYGEANEKSRIAISITWLLIYHNGQANETIEPHYPIFHFIIIQNIAFGGDMCQQEELN